MGYSNVIFINNILYNGSSNVGGINRWYFKGDVYCIYCKKIIEFVLYFFLDG